MPKTYIKSSGVWTEIKSIYLKSGGLWTNIKNAYLKVNGVWTLVFTANVPTIASKVIIEQGTPNATTGLITLTGTNYYWKDLGTGTLTYYFEVSYDGGTTWSTVNTGSISNPSQGSSNTKTYEVKVVDVLENTDNLFRFRVYADNGTNFAESISTSTTISTPRDITLTATSATVEGRVELNFTEPLYANSYKIRQVYKDVTPNTTTYIYKTTAPPYNITGLVVEGNYTFYIKGYTGSTLVSGATIGYPGFESAGANIKVYKEALPENVTKPSISGSGTTMTGNVGTWNPAATSYDVRFIKVDSSGIETTIAAIAPTPPNTTVTYTTSSQGVYYFEARGLNSLGAGNPYVRSVTSYEILQAPVNLTAPQISGTLNEGQTLTVSNGTWAYGPDSYSYQWQSSTNNSTYTNIPGATSNTYTIPSGYQASPGPYIKAYVVATNNGGSSSPAYATYKKIVPTSAPVNTVAPHLTNSGTTMTSTAGSWNYGPTSYTYRWYRDDLAPSSAGNPLKTTSNTTSTTDTYVGSASANYYVYTEVTATNEIGSTAAFSDNSITLYVAPTPTVPTPTIAVPTNTVAPNLTNVGTAMTVDAGTWTGSPTSYTYRWYRDDIVEGAANSLLKTTSNTTSTTDTYNGSNQNQYNYYVVVTATNAGGTSAKAYSNSVSTYTAPTPTVPTPTAQAPVNTVAPHMSNSGTAMTVTAGTWSYSPTSYVYRWYRDDLAETSNGNPLRTSSSTTSTTDSFTGSSSAQWNYYVKVTATNGVGSTAAYSDNSIYLYQAPPTPTPTVPTPTIPTPTVPTPTKPTPTVPTIPTPTVPTPTIPTPTVPTPTVPTPTIPTPTVSTNRNCTSTDYRTGMCSSSSGCDNSGCASGSLCGAGTNRRGPTC
jgi:hypothetical protein